MGSILRSGKHSFVEIGHEIISKAILSLPLIQVEQLSVTCERLVNCIGLSLPRKSVVRLTDHLDLTIVVDCAFSNKNRQ